VAIAQASKKRKHKRKKRKHQQTPPAGSPPAVSQPPPTSTPAQGGSTPPPAPPTYRWIVGWEDSRHDGLVRPVDDGLDHPTPQDPKTIPPRPLPAPQNPAGPVTGAGPGVYSGPFGRVQANRLLWRAGFGPRPGEAAALGQLTLQQAVYSLTRPSGGQTFTGPAPTYDGGQPIAPGTFYGHDHLWWLDRMVRADQPLIERMALVFHDWFATSNDKVNQFPLMQQQTDLFRSAWSGSFLSLLDGVTKDPAMLVWLDGIENTRWEPNENYAREVMELFTLGAERAAYTEQDVRELARTLTGWDAEWTDDGYINFHYDPTRHDGSNKTVFGRTGKWTVEDASVLCVENPKHPEFFVRKLWSYFIPTAPSAATLSNLINLYTSGSYAIRPVLEAILMHPDLYRGEAMVKPPAVYLAGLMRGSGVYVDREAWIWVSSDMGQQLFYPPNVSGWDDARWLDTNTMRARWDAVFNVMEDDHPDPDGVYDETETPEAGLERALGYWDYPPLRVEQHDELLRYSANAWSGPLASWQRSAYRALRQNALIELIAVSPDLHLS
jgi:hypothetical protein